MARCNGSITLMENVYCGLRHQILSGVLPPGTPLRPGNLKLQFDVSVAIVREALTRLAAEGLVKQNPNIGFSVISFSDIDLKNIIEARRINEEAALRCSIAKGNIEWESNLIALEYQLEHTTRFEHEEHVKYNEKWAAIHYKFHHALIEACGNPFLLDICDRLWYISELYRCWSVSNNPSRSTNDEHKSIMQAAISRDADRAVELFDEHICLTIKQIIK